MVPKLTLALRLARRFPDNPSLLAELREDKTIRRTIDAYDFLTGVAREGRTVTVADVASAVRVVKSNIGQVPAR